MARMPVLGVVGLAVLLAAGCGLTPQERISALQEAVRWGEEQSKGLDARITVLEGALGSARTLLADPNVEGQSLTEIRQAVEMLESKLAAVMPVKAKLDEALARYRVQLAAATAGEGALTVGDEIGVYGQGVGEVSTVLPAPYNIYAALLAVLLAAIGKIVGTRLQARKDDETFGGLVESVQALLDSDQVKDLEAAKNILARSQVKTPGTAAAVREALK